MTHSNVIYLRISTYLVQLTLKLDVNYTSLIQFLLFLETNRTQVKKYLNHLGAEILSTYVVSIKIQITYNKIKISYILLPKEKVLMNNLTFF